MDFVPDSEKVMDTKSDIFVASAFPFSLQLCNFFRFYGENFLPASLCFVNLWLCLCFLFFSIFNDFHFPYRQKSELFRSSTFFLFFSSFFELWFFCCWRMKLITRREKENFFCFLFFPPWCWMKYRERKKGGRERWRPIWCSHTNWLRSNIFLLFFPLVFSQWLINSNCCINWRTNYFREKKFHHFTLNDVFFLFLFLNLNICFCYSNFIFFSFHFNFHFHHFLWFYLFFNSLFLHW